MEKHLTDMRGRQASIARLFAFDKEAFLHMFVYRLILILSFVTGLAIIVGMITGSAAIGFAAELLLALLWLLFSVQVYESAKAFVVITSKGAALGHLNESFSNYGIKRSLSLSAYELVPYLVLAIWMLGFIIFIYEIIL